MFRLRLSRSVVAKKPKIPKDIEPVCNEGDQVTPGSIQADIHFRDLQLQETWDSKRVLRMCGWLQITEYELASMVMFPHDEMKKCMKKGIFPGPVCILFSLVENHVMRESIVDPVPEDSSSLIPFSKIHG